MWIHTLTAIIVLLAFTVAFILGVSIGAGSQGEIEFTKDTLSSWVASVSTFWIAILTIVIAKDSRDMRLLQTKQIESARKLAMRPNIDIQLKSSSADVNSIEIQIVNNGNGVARNIKFEFENEDTNAEDVYLFVQGKIEKLSMLSQGLGSLAAGENRVSYLFNGYQIAAAHQNIFEYKSKVLIRFEDLEGEGFTSFSWLSYGEFEGRSLSPTPIMKVSENLEKIEQALNNRNS